MNLYKNEMLKTIEAIENNFAGIASNMQTSNYLLISVIVAMIVGPIILHTLK